MLTLDIPRDRLVSYDLQDLAVTYCEPDASVDLESMTLPDGGLRIRATARLDVPDYYEAMEIETFLTEAGLDLDEAQEWLDEAV